MESLFPQSLSKLASVNLSFFAQVAEISIELA